MMTQSTLAVGGFDANGKVTRRAAFLTRMNKLVPWTALEELIEPHYPSRQRQTTTRPIHDAVHVLRGQLVQSG
jgi:IS5 family transposase